MASSSAHAAATAALVLLLVSSCTGDPAPPAASPPPAASAVPAPSSPSVDAGTPAAPSEPPRTAAPAPTPESTVTPTAGPPAAPGATADGERRGDRVRGHRTLTGTISRTGRWVLLDTGTKTWALLGAPSDRLGSGYRATVTGALTPVPPGCPAQGALAVSRAR